jgi:hypothetical protein
MNMAALALIVVGLVTGIWPLAALAAAFFALSYVRTTLGLRRAGQPLREALLHAGLLVLSKLPSFLGMLAYYRRARSGQAPELIEYK